MVSQYLAKLGGHRHCSGANIMVLVCHLILQDKRAGNLMGIIGRGFLTSLFSEDPPPPILITSPFTTFQLPHPAPSLFVALFK